LFSSVCDDSQSDSHHDKDESQSHLDILLFYGKTTRCQDDFDYSRLLSWHLVLMNNRTTMFTAIVDWRDGLEETDP
jgi:hypothetical protein